MTRDAAADIEARIARFPLRTIAAEGRAVAYREAGTGAPLVLLHGIGNQSGSWVQQLESLAGRHRLVAWDAPGYGGSDPLPQEAPVAADYARALAALLDALGLERATLVGSSLGCLVAASFAAAAPARAAGLALLNPAGGHAALDPRERQEKLAARLSMLERLGPQGMARSPSPGLLSAHAPDAARALAAWSTASLRPAGYAQAARMLSTGHLAGDAPRYPGPVLVVGSGADTVTPPPACRAIAAAFAQGDYLEIPDVGHLAYIEAPAEVNALIAAFAARGAAPRPAAREEA